ncbi:MAG TPA: DUF4412 domain-containing protein [Vicinamibacterales bacterium]|nr:DUF4412 domain-containing protein [Vicinamibacterales bacterium]
MIRILSATALALAVSAGPAAADGILIVQKTTTPLGTQTHNVQIEANRVRAEAGGRPSTSPGPSGGQVVIFDGARQTLWIVDEGRKSYTEMTKADADRVGGQMSAAMSAIQEQLKNMPPEQRAQMESMMRGRGMPGAPAAAAPKTVYKKVGTDTVGKWSCDKYEGYQDDKKVSELCTVDPKVLGFSAADFQVTRQLAEFFGRLIPQGADRLFAIGTPEQQGYSGVPVRTITFMGDQRTTSELVDAKRQSFPDATFQVPAGYTKEAGMFGGRGRGGQ